MESILGQGYPDLEYIVIDGGSSDGSVDVIRRYADRLAYWVSEKDDGQAHAINKGLSRATGDIIAYLNSDDWYEPEVLVEVGEAFASDPELKWLAGGVRYIWDDGKIDHDFLPTHRTLEECLGQRPTSGVVQPGVFFHRDVVERVGKFNCHLHYQFDHEYFVRCMAAGFAPRNVQKIFANYRLHRSSKTVSRAHLFLSDVKQTYQDYRSCLSRREQIVAVQYLERFERNLFLDTVYGFLADRDRGQALAYAAKRLWIWNRLESKWLYWGAMFRILVTGRPPRWFGADSR